MSSIREGMDGDGGLWLAIGRRVVWEVSHGWTADGAGARYLRDKAGNQWPRREDAPADVREAWLRAFGAWPGEPALEMARDPALLDAEFADVAHLYTHDRNAERAQRLRDAQAAS
jgi:hypothetical protein